MKQLCWKRFLFWSVWFSQNSDICRATIGIAFVWMDSIWDCDETVSQNIGAVIDSLLVFCSVKSIDYYINRWLLNRVYSKDIVSDWEAHPVSKTSTTPLRYQCDVTRRLQGGHMIFGVVKRSIETRCCDTFALKGGYDIESSAWSVTSLV